MEIKYLDGSTKTFDSLVGANLCGANLRGANLRGADLRGADLRGADLSGADLSGADLRGANLYDANLGGAYLSSANLIGAYLSGADLSGTDLSGANLYDANLRGANLRGADLRGADLCGADLRGANLYDANLGGADLCGAKGLDKFCILPAGTLRGYKKLADGTIAELEIPARAKRINAYGCRKCRASYAKVLKGRGVAQYDGEFRYEPGKIVRPRKPFDPDPRVQCGSGIHFFITKQEAIDY
jgi:hypothetical protein